MKDLSSLNLYKQGIMEQNKNKVCTINKIQNFIIVIVAMFLAPSGSYTFFALKSQMTRLKACC